MCLVKSSVAGVLVASTLILPVSAAGKDVGSQSNGHSMHRSAMSHHSFADQRQRVLYPRELYEASLRNMREHLRAIHRVQQLSAEGRFSEAASAADRGLGVGHNHGPEGTSAESAYMPEDMLALGRSMHASALNLSTVLREAEVTDDLQSVFQALSEVTANCVACHDAFRLEATD